jgi:hypothetical protein
MLLNVTSIFVTPPNVPEVIQYSLLGRTAASCPRSASCGLVDDGTAILALCQRERERERGRGREREREETLHMFVQPSCMCIVVQI